MSVCVECSETGEKLGVGMKEGGGWTEGRTFINIHVLILNILNILFKLFPVFNAHSCYNECF